MYQVIITLLIGLGIVAIGELMWRIGILKGEHARKFVHVLIIITAAFLPEFVTWHQLQLISVLVLGFVLVVRKTKAFKSWYDIDRLSWGDVAGALTVVVLAFFEPSRVLFAAAVLHVGLADGFAALVGKAYGKGNEYKVFGSKKSFFGTFTFVLVSLGIMLGVMLLPNDPPSVPALALIGIPIVTAAVENISPSGIDNSLIIGTVVALFRLFNIS